MKNILFFSAFLLLCFQNIEAQNPTETTVDKNQQQVIINKLDQTNVKRVVTVENEKVLYNVTKQIIKDKRYLNFTVLTGWYKQTVDYYYYQVGWDIDGKIVLQLLKYSWQDRSVTLSNDEEMKADTNIITATEVVKN